MNTTTSQPLLEDKEEDTNKDCVDLNYEDDMSLFAEFNPTMETPGTWDPPAKMSPFLKKHFNKTLTDIKGEAILQDFPKPNCPVLAVP